MSEQANVTATPDDYLQCVCGVIGKVCGTLTPCGIPEVIDAIKKGDWARVVSLIIQGGACAAAPAALLAAVIAGAISCALRDQDGAASIDDLQARLQTELERLPLERLLETS
ncbi:MAG TPA: hypothetical protein VEX86_01480 [Longimicrobium sp.]|nr:hypothetical protein [Longimicrobium sp.]